MLTSPPYFFLEDYRYGNQSCNENTSFDDWCTNFLYPTMDNSFKYAGDSPVIINIKDYKGFDMVARTKNYATSKGYICTTDILKKYI